MSSLAATDDLLQPYFEEIDNIELQIAAQLENNDNYVRSANDYLDDVNL